MIIVLGGFHTKPFQNYSIPVIAERLEDEKGHMKLSFICGYLNSYIYIY